MQIPHDPLNTMSGSAAADLVACTPAWVQPYFDAVPPELRETDPAMRRITADAIQRIAQERAVRACEDTRRMDSPWPSMRVYGGARLQVRNGMPVLLNPCDAVDGGGEPIAYLHRDPYDRALKITGEPPDVEDTPPSVATRLRRATLSTPFPHEEMSSMPAPGVSPGLMRGLAFALMIYAVLAAVVLVALYLRRAL